MRYLFQRYVSGASVTKIPLCARYSDTSPRTTRASLRHRSKTSARCLFRGPGAKSRHSLGTVNSVLASEERVVGQCASRRQSFPASAALSNGAVHESLGKLVCRGGGLLIQADSGRCDATNPLDPIPVLAILAETVGKIRHRVQPPGQRFQRSERISETLPTVVDSFHRPFNHNDRSRVLHSLSWPITRIS